MPLSTNLLTGNLVRLTALTEEDAAAMARWSMDATYLRLLDGRPAMPKTSAELAKEFTETQKSNRDFVFAVRPVNDTELIGYLEIDGIMWANRVGGLGIGFGAPEHRGKGFGTEAGQLGIRFAFHELNLHRLTATVFSYNARSLALCDKLGFKREGVFREFLERDGKRHDMILLGLLRHEWTASRA